MDPLDDGWSSLLGTNFSIGHFGISQKLAAQPNQNHSVSVTLVLEFPLASNLVLVARAFSNSIVQTRSN